MIFSCYASDLWIYYLLYILYLCTSFLWIYRLIKKGVQGFSPTSCVWAKRRLWRWESKHSACPRRRASGKINALQMRSFSVSVCRQKRYRQPLPTLPTHRRTFLIKHFYFPDEDWGSFMFSFVLNCVLIFVALLLVALIFPPCFKWALDTFYSMY